MTHPTRARNFGVKKSTLAGASKAAAALAAYEGVKQLYHSVNGMYKDHVVYTTSIEETDHAYSDVHEWLLELMPSEKQRNLMVSTFKKSELRFLEEDDDEYDELVKAGVQLTFNDRKPRRFTVDGHSVTAQVKRSEDVDANKRSMTPMCIEFVSRTQAGQQAVIDKIVAIQNNRVKREPVLRLVNQWGHWNKRSDLSLRDLDSVILPAAQKEAIVRDLGNFLDAQPEYERLDLPWHRGYMLHGPPGTGKTSLVKALANHFRLDLWYVPLGDLKEEASLINLLSEVNQRSILLLEDIDTVQITHDRDEEKKKGKGSAPLQINLSSLLNALDGVATPHGLITFMTTNNFETLDSALVRAGRMDRIELLDYPTDVEVALMFRRFYDTDIPVNLVPPGPLPISQAQVSEVFKRNLGNPNGAAIGLAQTLMEAGAL